MYKYHKVLLLNTTLYYNLRLLTSLIKVLFLSQNIKRELWVGLGGFKNNASTQMKNNIKPIVETLGWACGICIKPYAEMTHSSSETTKIYTHPNLELARKWVDRLPVYS